MLNEFSVKIKTAKKNKIMTAMSVNILLFWLLLIITTIITNVICNKTKVILINIVVWILVYTFIFVVLEILYFKYRINVWNEEDRVASSYAWFDVYLDQRGGHDADLTEGYFPQSWNVSADEAIRNKFDAFYDLLNLQSGMIVLDIGCGYGQWMLYLRSRRVKSVGLTLSKEQCDFCKKQHGLDVRVQDIRNNNKLVMFGQVKFDAITLIGCTEHMAKANYPEEQRRQIYRNLFTSFRLLLKSDSASGRVLKSGLTCMREQVYGVTDYAKIYLLERHYSGRYPLDDELQSQATVEGFDRIYYSDQTEDYRWISIINPEHFGNFRIHWTPFRLLYAWYMCLSDPFALHKWLYHGLGVWMWHLGGTSTIPDQNRQAPCRLKWEVFQKI